ncbi:MAG: hypothetical protein ACM3O3_05125 [Syntrophothermus sp.]
MKQIKRVIRKIHRETIRSIEADIKKDDKNIHVGGGRLKEIKK